MFLNMRTSRLSRSSDWIWKCSRFSVSTWERESGSRSLLATYVSESWSMTPVERRDVWLETLELNEPAIVCTNPPKLYIQG